MIRKRLADGWHALNLFILAQPGLLLLLMLMGGELPDRAPLWGSHLANVILFLLAIVLTGGLYHACFLYFPRKTNPDGTPAKKRSPLIAARLCESALLLFALFLIVQPFVPAHDGIPDPSDGIWGIGDLAHRTNLPLCRCRTQWPSSAAIGNLRTLLGAQNAYQSIKGVYAASLADLTSTTPPFLDGNWDTTKYGYDFSLTTSANGTGFEATALPHEYKRGFQRGFYADETGLIRQSKDVRKTKPGKGSPPIGE
jgi:hypothetical protein